jgi:hypothetical protein
MILRKRIARIMEYTIFYIFVACAIVIIYGKNILHKCFPKLIKPHYK